MVLDFGGQQLFTKVFDEGVKRKEILLSLSPAHAQVNQSGQWYIMDVGVLLAQAANNTLFFPLTLPQGAQITKIEVLGNQIAEDNCVFSALRNYQTNKETSFTSSVFGGVLNLNVENEVGDENIIDNINNSYLIQITQTYGSLVADLFIWGVRITYTI